jgi:hypothetical protein
MSVDLSWIARLPGKIPSAMLRAGLEQASRKSGTAVRFVADDDDVVEGDELGEELDAYGAVVDVHADGLGDLTLFQPDDDDGFFHMAISASESERGPAFDQLFDAADALAACLGLVFSNDNESERRENRSEGAESFLDVVSVRVEIGLCPEPARGRRGNEPPTKSRVVSLAARPLAKIRPEQVVELEQAVTRAVSSSLSLGQSNPSLDQLVAWSSDSAYDVVERDDGFVRLRRTADDEEDTDNSSPLVSVSISDETVRLVAWPAIDLDFREALVKNDDAFSGSAVLALDSDGDWMFSATIRRNKLDKRAFTQAIDDFVDDLELLIEECGAPDGGSGNEDDDASENEDDETEDESENEDDDDGADESDDAAPPSRRGKRESASRADELRYGDRYTRGAWRVIQRAQGLADERRHSEITLLHLVACLDEALMAEALLGKGGDSVRARNSLEKELAELPTSESSSYLSEDVLTFLDRAEANAAGREVAVSDLVVALIDASRLTGEDDERARATSSEQIALQRVLDAGRFDRAAGPREWNWRASLEELNAPPEIRAWAEVQSADFSQAWESCTDPMARVWLARIAGAPQKEIVAAIAQVLLRVQKENELRAQKGTNISRDPQRHVGVALAALLRILQDNAESDESERAANQLAEARFGWTGAAADLALSTELALRAVRGVSSRSVPHDFMWLIDVHAALKTLILGFKTKGIIGRSEADRLLCVALQDALGSSTAHVTDRSNGDLRKLTDAQLVGRLYVRAIHGGDRSGPVERIVATTISLENEVQNGGFGQFFHHWSDEAAQEAQEAYGQMGRNDLSTLVADARRRAKRMRKSDLLGGSAFDELNTRFWEALEDDPDALRATYARRMLGA